MTLLVALCFVVRTFGNSERTDADIAGTKSLTIARFTVFCWFVPTFDERANVSTSYILTAAAVNNNRAINSSADR